MKRSEAHFFKRVVTNPLMESNNNCLNNADIPFPWFIQQCATVQRPWGVL